MRAPSVHTNPTLHHQDAVPSWCRRVLRGQGHRFFSSRENKRLARQDRKKILSPQPAALKHFTEAVQPRARGAKHRSDLLKITTTASRGEIQCRSFSLMNARPADVLCAASYVPRRLLIAFWRSRSATPALAGRNMANLIAPRTFIKGRAGSQRCQEPWSRTDFCCIFINHLPRHSCMCSSGQAATQMCSVPSPSRKHRHVQI